jgi:hypothetical protein
VTDHLADADLPAFAAALQRVAPSSGFLAAQSDGDRS